MWQRRDFLRTATVQAALGGGLLVAAPAEAAAARVVSERRLGPRVRDLTIASPAMRRNMRARLILPRGWNRREKWPLLWLLHGGNDDYRAWTRESEIMRLSAARRMMVVMPEGGAGGGYTDWMSGPQWETFHLEELRGILMRRYGAARRQAVAGLSAGGYGALIYSARHPGMFAFTGSFSGYGATLVPGAPEVLLTGVPGSGAEKFLMWGQPQLDRDVWEAHDPLSQAHRLRGTKLYISCARNGVKGPLDTETTHAADPAEAFCLYTTRPLLARLRRLKIPVTADLYPKGTHTWPYFRRGLRRSWPVITRALRA